MHRFVHRFVHRMTALHEGNALLIRKVLDKNEK